MPRRSSILSHPHQAAIDRAILERRSPWKAIATEYGLPYDAVRRYARRLISDPQRMAPPVAPAMGPVQTFERAFGFTAMPHQVEYLTETRPTLVRKARQVGMTAAAAGLAVYTARSQPGSTSVVISPSQRQSQEVTSRGRLALWELGEHLRQDSASLLRTESGSRIISLPGKARGIRGYACELVIIDEAAFVDDDVWDAARPLVAATSGRVIVQSTPGNPIGWFHDLASDPPDGWATIVVRADQVPIVSPEFLARERATMSPALYAQEYEAEFTVAAGGGLFDLTAFDAALVYDDEPEEVSV